MHIRIKRSKAAYSQILLFDTKYNKPVINERI